MAKKTYPRMLVLDQSIEFIDSEETFNDSLHGLDEATKRDTFYILEDGQCFDLAGNKVTTLGMAELTALVQQQLIAEGQCCVSKLQLQDVSQAFSLLSEWA